MKRFVLTIFAVLMATTVQTAIAEEEIITLVPVVTPEPAPKSDLRPVTIIEHDISEKDIERIARLLWCTNVTDDHDKKSIIWVVMNRVNDKSDLFGDTVSEVVTTSEFEFFDSHAHRSEKNLQLVRETMNEYLSWKDGYNIGKHPSSKALYMSFSGDNHEKVVISQSITDWKTLEW